MTCQHLNTMETLDSYVCEDCGLETCVFNDNAGDKMLCSTHDGELRMTDEDWEDDSILMICDNAPELITIKELTQWTANVGDWDKLWDAIRAMEDSHE